MASKIPALSHHQILVLHTLQNQQSGTSGKEVRDRIFWLSGEQIEGPRFYQLMHRLERNGLVRGKPVSKMVDKQRIVERFYFRTKAGNAALKQALDFYEVFIRHETGTPQVHQRTRGRRGKALALDC